MIAKSVDRLERLTGKKLRGWFGPGAGESLETPDLIKAAGIDWLADWFVDDLPCWMRTRHGPLVAMPYTVEINDVPLYVVQQQSSEEMLKRLESTIKLFEAEMMTHPKVLTIALHPHVMGVAHRADVLARCLEVLLARDDTIFVTGSEIADWFIAEDGTGGAAVAQMCETPG